MQFVLFSTAVSLVIALVATPLLIDLLRSRNVGQLIREDGPAAHFVKHGTPTMGGLVIIVASTTGYVVAHLPGGRGGPVPYSKSALLVIAAMWGMGFIGWLDDFWKIRHRRSLGLNKRAKMAGQVVVGGALAWGAIAWAGLEAEITWAGAKVPVIPPIGAVAFAVWVVIMIAGTSNAVNLTDGLDGLASGSAAMSFFVLSVIGFWLWRNSDPFGDSYALIPNDSAGFLDVAVVAAALLGACIGFLWWNAAPARIFMGDTGSLALGGALAALSLFTRTQILLLLIGGLFVIETLSVIVQVVSYRGFGGRRVFAMAPLHHHFELRGWAEFTVIVRFWLIAALFAGLGLALFYQDFILQGGGQ